MIAPQFNFQLILIPPVIGVKQFYGNAVFIKGEAFDKNAG
jgi:hypothetical protein